MRYPPGVPIFTKKNAAVGYITLKAMSRARQRRLRKRSRLKVGLYVALGLVSLGILAGVVAVLVRRQNGAGDELEASFTPEDEGEIVGEYVSAAAEPIPAT